MQFANILYTFFKEAKMMKIVLYTQSENSKSIFNQIIPGQLPSYIYTCHLELKNFLETLKVPSQILLDLESFPINIHDFLTQYNFHHIICIKENVNYELSIALIKRGSLLTTWKDLWSMHWWWNRTLIHFEKTSSDSIAEKSILLLPRSSEQFYRNFIEQNFWKTLFTYRPLIGMFDGRHSYSRIYSELENFHELISSQKKGKSFEVVAQFNHLSHISPYGFKNFLEKFCDFFQQYSNVKLFLLPDENQYAFDKILIPCFETKKYELYKMNIESLEDASHIDIKQQSIKSCIFEHIKIGDRQSDVIKKN
jgi:hypothetical protein